MSNEAMPQIFIDLNARMTDNGFLLTKGSLADLAKLGLTPEAAVGKRFTFMGGDDEDNGRPADIMFDGTIQKDETFGYLAVADANGIYWKAKP